MEKEIGKLFTFIFTFIAKIVMRLLYPFRYTGITGTPEEPIYIDKGQRVPWWITLVFPFNVKHICLEDIETYWENGGQVIRPVHKKVIFLTKIDANPIFIGVVVVGAGDTVWIMTPRTPPGKKNNWELSNEIS